MSTLSKNNKVCLNGLVDAGNSELVNKPNEPAFKMGLTLNRIVFKCREDRKPVNVPIKLFNPTNDTISFKVRCTSADIFRVQPPLGIVKPKSAVDIVVWYQNQTKVDAQSMKHYFAFYHTNVKADEKLPAKEIWFNAKPEGVRRVPATFEKI